jgi:hypothetical protein
MEPSRRNQWQAPANRPAAKTAGISEICCGRLRLVAACVRRSQVQILLPLLLEARHERAFFIAPASSDAAAHTKVSIS